MSGHSKWSTIKHKKSKTDAQRGKIFSKLAREILMAAKLGDSDPGTNTRLRLAIQKAKEANMPNDNIDRAIKKGSGSSSSEGIEEILFEAYGPFGVAILINTLTDNRNRTVANIRHILSKGNGSLATKGAVSYLFSKKAVFLFDSCQDSNQEDHIMTIATDNNALDVDLKNNGDIVVLAKPSNFEPLKNAFNTSHLSYTYADLEMTPSNYISLDDNQAITILKLLDKLDDDDDVQNVFSNIDISDEVLKSL